MDHDYPDDGHIYVCVRVRDVATVPGMSLASPSSQTYHHHHHYSHSHSGGSAVSSSRRSARERLRDARRLCLSTVQDVLVLHDPRGLDDPAAVARDAEGVVQFLTHRMAAHRSKRLERTFLTATATAHYFHFDRCVNSMDAAAMMQMPLIRNSDFLQPPEYGSQEDVYRCTATHAVAAALQGINSCVFAYGQTGSGKTYTLFGDTTCMRRDPGVVPRTLDDLFRRLDNIKREYANNSETSYSFRVQLSFFEIYQNEVFCLLSRKGPLRVSFARDAVGKDEAMVIHDLQQQVVASAEKAYPLIEMGLRRRQTGETGMNERSSRSHGILHVRVTQWRTNRETKESVEHNAKLNLVDLAGSERQKTAKTDGKSREEGIQINQSLATLARVINEISRGAKFVNYRDSLLTMLLKDNLGGNSKTFMIATVAPVSFCYQESCATLQYAKDVRKIRNRPMVNKTFQTRSNLLELNARLKQENEHLKRHIESLLTEIRTHEGGEGAVTVKEMNAADKTLSVDNAAHVSFAAPTFDGVAVPFVVTTHRVRASISGFGGFTVKDGGVRMTALAKDTVLFRIADLIGPSSSSVARLCDGGEDDDEEKAKEKKEGEEEGKAGENADKERKGKRGPQAAAAAAAEKECDLGAIQFERISQRSCEQRVWVRLIPPAGGAVARGVECQVNGKLFSAGDDLRPVSNGDVICVYLEGGGDRQSLLTMHYVDVNSLAPAAHHSAPDAHTLPEAPSGKENDVEHLRRENAKLLDMLQAQACTIDYQRHRGAQSRSRLASLSNNHYDPITSENSPSPIPVLPHERMEPLDLSSNSPLQMTNAGRTFYRSSVSPFIRDHSRSTITDAVVLAASGNSRSFDRSGWRKQTLQNSATKRNQAYLDLGRQLAELEASASPKRNAPDKSVVVPAFKIPKTALSDTPTLEDEYCKETFNMKQEEDEEDGRKEQQQQEEKEEEVEKEEDVGEEEGKEDEESVCTTVSEDREGPSVTTENPRANLNPADFMKTGASPEELAFDADDILYSHREKMENEKGVGPVHLFLSTSDGVCERYYAAKRERVLCERIWLLERTLEDLRGEMSLLESRLRIAQDGGIEGELHQAQMEDELSEMSKALAVVTEENVVLQREMASLETFLARTEEALAAASAVNEAEMEKRVARMANEICGLKTVARMWKRRAMQRFAYEFGGDNSDAGSEEENAMNGMRSGQVPWDELRVESNVERAKKLLGSRGLTAAAVKAIDQFEKGTAIESVVALERVLAELEHENLRLMHDIRTYEQELRDYRELVPRLRREKEELEKKGNLASSSAEEAKRLKARYAAKCEELDQAERQCATVEAKLRAAVQKTGAVMKKSAKSNDLLLKEQRLMLERERGERDKLQGALTAKDEELRTVLRFLQEQNTTSEIGGVNIVEELHERIEKQLEDALDTHGNAPNAGYSVFPPDFTFPEDVVALIRVCLRVLMDQLKVELYVLNRQSLHKFSLLVPTVQLRPEAQFHSFMHELRGVVVEMANKPQRIGGKWSVEEPDVLAHLVDHRRRRAGTALNGLLIWYDHWDLAPKAEHVCYMELIRNRDRIMQVARIVRQESLVNTNATSALRFVMPSKGGAFGVFNVPEASNDTSVMDSRRILERLTNSTKRSNLARVAFNARTTGHQTTSTAASASPTPRRSGRLKKTAMMRPPPSRAAVKKETCPPPVPFVRRETATASLNISTEHALDDAKFGRRATALVVPVSENDVAFAAASAVVQQDTSLSFARHASTANLPDDSCASLPAGKLSAPAGAKPFANRFVRAGTEMPSTFAAFADLRRPAARPAAPSPTPRRSSAGRKHLPQSQSTQQPQPQSAGGKHSPQPQLQSAAKSAKSRAAAGAAAADVFRRTRTAFVGAVTPTTVSRFSSGASGRRPANRPSLDGALQSPQARAKVAPLSSLGVTAPFYDPSVMDALRERKKNESRQQPPPPPEKLRVRSPAATQKGATANGTPRIAQPSVDRAKTHRSSVKVESAPDIPRLRFKVLRK